MKTILNLWINYKQANQDQISKFGLKLTFEWFISQRTHLVFVYNAERIAKMFPQYFVMN